MYSKKDKWTGQDRKRQELNGSVKEGILKSGM